jgi:hypothetical protein
MLPKFFLCCRINEFSFCRVGNPEIFVYAYGCISYRSNCISGYIEQQHEFFHSDHRISSNKVTPRGARDQSQRTCEGRFSVLKMAAAVRVRIGSVTKNYVQTLLLQSHTLKIKQRLSFHKSSFLFGECCLCEFVTWGSEI